jgi:hypothetical protein
LNPRGLASNIPEQTVSGDKAAILVFKERGEYLEQ